MAGTEFEDWYRSEHAQLVRTLTVICAGDVDVATEAAGEAFARALERWERVRQMRSPGGWVHTVAVNLVRRRHRRAALERTVARSTAGQPAPPPAEPDVETWAAVATLPERTRTAIALRYIADLTEPEIARVMGVANGTVSSLLHQGRRRLAELLDHDEPVQQGGLQ